MQSGTKLYPRFYFLHVRTTSLHTPAPQRRLEGMHPAELLHSFLTAFMLVSPPECIVCQDAFILQTSNPITCAACKFIVHEADKLLEGNKTAASLIMFTFYCLN